MGPDGAGKTTLAVNRWSDEAGLQGSLYTLGIDVPPSPRRYKTSSATCLNALASMKTWSVMENLNLYADLHGVPMDERRERF